MTDLVIIGAGPAGLTAAIYALRAGIKVTILEENMYGGQMSITNNIENYPGFTNITGPELSNIMYKQVHNLGGEFIFEKVQSVNLSKKIKKINTATKELYSYSIVLANGLKRRILGCRGEKEFTGKGVSYCATCDGAFFKDKDVAIVGGGNTAVEDAIYLSNICNSVTIILRKDYFRAERYLQDLMSKKDNIKVIKKSRIKEIKGDRLVNLAVIEDDYGVYTELKVSGIFIAIGYEPDNKIYNGQVNMDERGYFTADESCVTNIPGVFVAGDCRIKPLYQIVTAASDGAIAGNKAIQYITSLNL